MPAPDAESAFSSNEIRAGKPSIRLRTATGFELTLGLADCRSIVEITQASLQPAR
jgi:hypothetical protein